LPFSSRFENCFAFVINNIGEKTIEKSCNGLKLSLLRKSESKVNYITMRRKRKKKQPDRPSNKIEENRTFFDKPFKVLHKDLKDFGTRKEPVSPHSLPEKKKKECDEDLFQAAMKDVTPFKSNKNTVLTGLGKEDTILEWSFKPHKKTGEDFSNLVKELSAWDISFSDEYMEGAVAGIGPKIMKRLKRGEFSVQDYIDLHGLTRKEAETVVEEFILKSYHAGMRCVLIVHGRGLRSLNNLPAIKRELPVWFRRGTLKKIVLAFVTAKPCDGGAGALYVLLKKR
jgi:DNA-nicking Smr family endonuclease